MFGGDDNDRALRRANWTNLMKYLVFVTFFVGLVLSAAMSFPEDKMKDGIIAYANTINGLFFLFLIVWLVLRFYNVSPGAHAARKELTVWPKYHKGHW